MKRRLGGLKKAQEGSKNNTSSLTLRLGIPERRMNIQNRISCNPCKYNGENLKATVYCSACNEHLCFTCEKSHRGLKLTRGHDLVTIKDIPPIVKHEPVSPTCEGDIAEGTSTAIVIRTNNSLTRPESHTIRLCQTCRGKGASNAHDALCKDCQKSSREMKTTWYGVYDDENEVSSDEQEPTLQHCKAHIAEVIKYYCETHKALICELCQEKSHQECHKTLLPGISNNLRRLGEIENDTGSDFIAINAEIKCQSNQQSLVTCTLGESATSNENSVLEKEDQTYRRTFTYVHSETKMISCAQFLSNGKLIFHDLYGHALKLYDSNFHCLSSLTVFPDSDVFGSYPVFTNDMCKTSDTEVATTEPLSNTIQFVSTEPVLSLGDSFTVHMPCYGIDCYLGMLYMICEDNGTGKCEILVTTKEGQIQRLLKLNDDGRYSFICPHRIRVSRNSGRMYVADNLNNTVTCLTQHGNVVYEYKHTDLLGPSDIYIDSEDNIFVCGFISNNVHRVDKNGNHHSVLVSESSGVISPLCLAYRYTDGALAIGMRKQPSCMVYWIH